MAEKKNKQKSWAEVKYVDYYIKNNQPGVLCVIILDDTYNTLLTRRIFRNVCPIHDYFYPIPVTHFKKAYSGFCPQGIYEDDLKLGRQIAYHRAFSDYHSDYIRITDHLMISADSLKNAVQKAVDKEYTDMDSVRTRTRQLLEDNWEKEVLDV